MKSTNVSQKACSVCGMSFPIEEFTYRSRENRSYCRLCDAAVTKAHAQGGAEAARAFREDQRRKWRRA